MLKFFQLNKIVPRYSNLIIALFVTAYFLGIYLASSSETNEWLSELSDNEYLTLFTLLLILPFFFACLAVRFLYVFMKITNSFMIFLFGRIVFASNFLYKYLIFPIAFITAVNTLLYLICFYLLISVNWNCYIVLSIILFIIGSYSIYIPDVEDREPTLGIFFYSDLSKFLRRLNILPTQEKKDKEIEGETPDNNSPTKGMQYRIWITSLIIGLIMILLTILKMINE